MMGKNAIEGLKHMPSITEEKLIRMKDKNKPDAVICFCNVCGTPHSFGFYCCPVDDNPDAGVGNFTRCVVWFTTGVMKRVIKKETATK